MKIKDSELLQAIWELQIKNASENVLHSYISGGHGVACNTSFWLSSSTSVHICSRHKITKLIGKQQIFKRIRDMISKGSIEWKHQGCTFGIKSEVLNKSLFQDARNFWVGLGVPTGIENGRCNNEIIDNFSEKKKAAVDYLLKNHSHKLYPLEVQHVR